LPKSPRSRPAMRAVPASAAASAQSTYAAASSGLGGGLVMLTAGARYADYGGCAYFLMAILSALGVVGTIQLRRALPAEREPADHDRCCKDREGKNGGPIRREWGPLNRHAPFSIGSGPRAPRYPRAAQ